MPTSKPAKHTLTRRSFLQLSTSALAVSSLPLLTGCTASPLLCNPRVRRSINGILDTSLEARFALNHLGKLPIWTRTFEGSIPGPTLRVRPGDTLRVKLKNRLPMNHDEHPMDINTPHHFNSINLHTHGFHVSPTGNSDNVFIELEPGNDIDLQFDIPADHPAGTYWYHPHKHGAVALHLVSGMAGAIIIEGDIDEVPEIAAAKEQVIVMNEIRVVPNADDIPDGGGGHHHKADEETDCSIFDFVNGVPEDYGLIDGAPIVRTVNGQVNPIVVMRPGEVQRWRLLNAGMAQYLPLQLEEHELHVIAHDGITVAAPESVDSVLLAPGMRADVLVKAGKRGVYVLKKLEFDQGRGPVAETDMLTLIVRGEALDMPLPETLPVPTSLPAIADEEIVRRRNLTFNVVPVDGQPVPDFLIDGNKFDPNRVDHTMTLDSAEEWTVSNFSAEYHPFHIHTNPFLVTRVNGAPLAIPVWRDTVDLEPNGNVTFRTRFADFTGQFVLHCHIVDHEDFGMMQLLEVIAPQ